MRVFLAHPKSWDNDLVDAAAAELRESIARGLGKPVTVTSGRDDFLANIASEGNINGWCRSVTRRTDEHGNRWYEMVAIPKTDGIGKATATIAQAALDARMSVVEVEYLDDGSVEARAVDAIETEDGENYLAGWRVIVADT